MGQTSEQAKTAWDRSKPRHWQANRPDSLIGSGFRNDYRSGKESARFFASVVVSN
jgi:hypothetical protein